MSGVKNIILDLGGVIINLDQNRTVQAFNELAGKNIFENIYSKSAQSGLFDSFDTGQLDEDSFFKEVAKEISYSGPHEPLVRAWNAMLLDVPEHRLDLLVDLRLDYNTYLLSNTCETHIKSFERSLYRSHGVKNFNDYFDRVYYSCRIGLRKPDPAIFQRVLEENDLVPDETVFIDDSVQHVRGAGACGIRAYLLQPGVELRDLLKELSLL